MLDDLRSSAVEQFPEEELPPEEEGFTPRSRKIGRRFLGMTAVQRFVIAVLILLMTCVGSLFCLVLTGSVWV